MITAEFYKHGKKIVISVVGHADYAPNGYDIVCAAVSSLTIALANVVNNKSDCLYLRPQTEIEHGKMLIVVAPKPFKKSEIYNYLYFYYIGIAAISKQYPNNIVIKKNELF